MGLLHILFGAIFRAVTPQDAQDAMGKVLFWLVGIPLLLAVLGAIGWVLILNATGNLHA